MTKYLLPILLCIAFCVAAFAAPQTASKTITINVVSKLTFDTVTLPSIVVGQAYNVTLSASGGTAPYTFSVASDSVNPLPSGLTLNANTGVISGTVTALPGSCSGTGPCSVSIKFQVTDSTP